MWLTAVVNVLLLKADYEFMLPSLIVNWGEVLHIRSFPRSVYHTAVAFAL